VPAEVGYEFRCHFAGGGSSAFPSLLRPSRPNCNKFLEIVPFQEFSSGLWYPLQQAAAAVAAEPYEGVAPQVRGNKWGGGG
jgi:hypothetical protein